MSSKRRGRKVVLGALTWLLALGAADSGIAGSGIARADDPTLFAAADSAVAPAEAPRVETPSSSLSTDSFVTLVPARTVAEIRRDFEGARARETAAQAALGRARDQIARAQARIEVKKKELETIDARINLARKSAQDAERRALESQKKVHEIELSMLERRKDLHQAEEQAARAGKDYAAAAARAYEIEIDLAGKRSEHAGVGLGVAATTPAGMVSKLEAGMRGLERRTLDAQKEQASRNQELSRRERELAEIRLKLFEAQWAVLGGRG